MTLKLMTDLDLTGKRVLIREDLNVPIREGVVTSDTRIRAALPGIEFALAAGAKVIVMSHLGRPTEGEYDQQYSMAPVAKHLGELLGQPVRLEQSWTNGLEQANGELVMLENVRFNPGEKKNDHTLAKGYARLCDIFVMDAFGTAHRAQASTHGVAKYAPVACAGPLLARELDALEKALQLIDTGRRQLSANGAGELLAEDLRQAQNHLSEITGQFTSDDLLGHIFSSFCIGK